MKITNKKTLEFDYKMNDSSLTPVNHHPYLGVELDSNLNWNQHINNITMKGTRALNFLKRNLHNCPPSIKEKAYTTLVRPCIEYCAPIWDPYKKQHILKLERIQQQAARFVLNKPFIRDNKGEQDGGTTLVNKLNWPLLKTRRLNYRLTAIYKILNNKLSIPPAYAPSFSTTKTRKNHNMTLKQALPHLDAYKYSLIPRSITDWNNLSQYQVDSPTTESFKTSLHTKPLKPTTNHD